jgi:lipid-A-disaccharide synthase
MEQRRLIYVIAGEPSGDAIGARLIAALKAETGGAVEIIGIGGSAMEETGFKSLFPIQELSVMGLLEVLPHAGRILRRIDEAAKDIRARAPEIIVTIDSPSFAIRVIKKLTDLRTPKIHFVAPTVWAWRPWRVHKFKKYYDLLLTVLPFEPPYFERVGLNAVFVGHPVMEYGVATANGLAFRQRHGIEEHQCTICLLPGSRRGEVERHLGIFGDALQLLADRRRAFTTVIPTLPSVVDFVRQRTANWSVPPIILVGPDEKYDAMRASDVALAASGTVSLELAIAEVPTVIAYRVNPLTAFIVRRLIKVDFVSILNILADREIMPERLQESCRAELLALDLERLIGPDGREQVNDLKPYIEQLRSEEGAPSQVAAKYILSATSPR